jgi:hypothetical protein
MENHDPAAKTIIGFIVGSGLLGVLAVGWIAVAQQADIAISVAEQHGQELLLIRGELTALRTEMLQRTQDRFTAADGRYLEQEIRRIEEELDEIIERQRQ